MEDMGTIDGASLPLILSNAATSISEVNPNKKKELEPAGIPKIDLDAFHCLFLTFRIGGSNINNHCELGCSNDTYRSIR